MIIQIIGWYCFIHAIMGEIALFASVAQKDILPDGARARANFITIGYLSIVVWCFK